MSRMRQELKDEIRAVEFEYKERSKYALIWQDNWMRSHIAMEMAWNFTHMGMLFWPFFNPVLCRADYTYWMSRKHLFHRCVSLA